MAVMKGLSAERSQDAWRRDVLDAALAKAPERRSSFATLSGQPVDRLYTADSIADLEYGRGADREQDLRDRELEVEADLPDDLERDDHPGQVETRIGELREQDRVRPAADREGGARGRRCGVRGHSPAPC